MNRKDLIEEVQGMSFLPKDECSELVDLTILAIAKGIEKDGIVKLIDLGTFRKKQRKGRAFIHPETGERKYMPDYFSVAFKPSSAMERRVNNE